MLLGMVTACGARRETTVSGATMGTTYHIKVVGDYFKRTSGLQSKIEARLVEINQRLSLYIPESEISRFNALKDTKKKTRMSPDFRQVLQVGSKLYNLTGGAWDATVRPLVNLWGFGDAGNGPRMPDKAAIAEGLKAIGFEDIILSKDGFIQKRRPMLSLDLGSIAKGYAVDQVALLLQKEGFKDYLVEIGGEVYAGGTRKDGKPWRVGVNLPEKGAALDAVYDVVALKGMAIATSGDYRNFFEKDGKRFSHILDPKSGYPVANGVVSVSIIAKTCTFADGLATAAMVMGLDRGMSLVESLDGVEALFILQLQDKSLKAFASKGFSSYQPGDL